jgi:Phage tail sheath protein FI
MFIGYTEKAEYKGESVLNKPFRISSFADYRAVFGENAQMKFKVSEEEEKLKVELANTKRRFRLFDAIRLFYQNGGATCYIMSVGSYNDDIDEKALQKALTPFEKEPEPTLVVIPEAVSLETLASCTNVQNEMLAHCAKMKNRFAILDVFNGFNEPNNCIETFRKAITNNLEYGAVYYPWLNTSVVQSNEVTFLNIDPPTDLVTILKKDVPETATDITEQIDKITTTTDDVEVQSVHQTLMMNCPKYPVIMNMIREQWNLMPPAGAIAGIYTMVDNSVGVWKAPANVGINGVITPAVNLSNEEQEDLNVPVNGKAVNAIRTFVGDGNKSGAHARSMVIARTGVMSMFAEH